jgi:hypothetical protein
MVGTGHNYPVDQGQTKVYLGQQWPKTLVYVYVPMSKVTPKMTRNSQSKITTTSNNSCTKMLLLVVGDIGYPEVLVGPCGGFLAAICGRHQNGHVGACYNRSCNSNRAWIVQNRS